MLNEIEKKIIETIAYYNEFEYPLTPFEIWKYLISRGEFTIESKVSNKKTMGNRVELLEIIDSLGKKDLQSYIEEFRGFYFLKGQKNLVAQRLKRNKISVAKIKNLRKKINFLKMVPFVRMIGVTGTLAMKNADRESDWDLLIIFRMGRIWIGRTLFTLLAHLLGVRRHGNKIKDRICLNYFITDESLEIRSKDLFSASEYQFMISIFDTGNFWRKFQLKNRWIQNYKPNYSIDEIGSNFKVEDSSFSKLIRAAEEKIFNFDWLENKLRTWERKKILANPKTYGSGSFIEASDEALIFLPDPQGPKVFEKFKKEIARIKL